MDFIGPVRQLWIVIQSIFNSDTFSCPLFPAFLACVLLSYCVYFLIDIFRRM